MHVGRAPDEQELAREESHSNVGWDPLTAIKNVFRSPAATAALFGSGAGVISAVAAAALTAPKKSGGKAKAAPTAATPADAPGQPPDNAAVPQVSAPAQSATMGLDTYTDEYISSLISKENDTDKKKRMIFSHGRAKNLRTSSGMLGLSEVDEAIGELFARMPVDSKSNPSMDKSHINAIASRIAEKRAAAKGQAPTQADYISARQLLATYVRINGVATPGLKVAQTS